MSPLSRVVYLKCCRTYGEFPLPQAVSRLTVTDPILAKYGM